MKGGRRGVKVDLGVESGERARERDYRLLLVLV